MEHEFKFSINSRGNKCLIVDDEFIFNFIGTEKSTGISKWRCKEAHNGCKFTCKSNGDKIVEENHVHSHIGSNRIVRKGEINSELKREVTNRLDIGVKRSDKEILNEHLEDALIPDFEEIKTSLYRSRRAVFGKIYIFSILLSY